jgi:hypothetical protein
VAIFQIEVDGEFVTETPRDREASARALMGVENSLRTRHALRGVASIHVMFCNRNRVLFKCSRQGERNAAHNSRTVRAAQLNIRIVPPSNGAALRARRLRQRRRLGLKIYTIVADEFELIAAILDARLLTEKESRDDAKVSAVISRIILSDWIAQIRR